MLAEVLSILGSKFGPKITQKIADMLAQGVPFDEMRLRDFVSASESRRMGILSALAKAEKVMYGKGGEKND